MAERLDKFMLDQEMVKTRSQARMLIKQGDVLVNTKVAAKPGLMVTDSDKIEIKQRNLYVSRGAFKLLHAIESFSLSFQDKLVADCGASTGGFSQISLLNGASKVYAIDVGHDQLDSILLNNPKVINLEGVNLKKDYKLPELVDFCVVDLSFISLKLVLKTIKSFLKPTGKIIALIKPQFEAGKERIGKGGIVSEKNQEIVLKEVLDWLLENNFEIIKQIESPITGKTGNKEFLVLLS